MLFDLGEQHNPYTPTYTFPTGFDGDLERMENYIRRAASETTDDQDEKKSENAAKVATVK